MATFRIKRFSFHTDHPNTIKLKSGIVLTKYEQPDFFKFLSKFFKSLKQDNYLWYDATLDGKDLGEIQVDYNPSDNMMHLGWIWINYDQRCKGYATEVIQYFISEAKKRKYKGIYLEATPQGYPIYKKLGFEDTVLPDNRSILRKFFDWSWGFDRLDSDYGKLKEMKMIF